MNNFYKAGQNMFLVGIAELAVYGFVRGDVAMTRPPFGEALQSVNPGMAYAIGAVMLICVLAFYLNRYRAAALVTLASVILLLVSSRHVVNLLRDRINAFKTLLFIGGALLILSSIGSFRKQQKTILQFNLIILFMFFLECGIVHFQFADLVKDLIPAYIPFALFFTYYAGLCLFFGGVGLLLPSMQKVAALLLGIQIAAWFFLLHIPRALTLKGDEWIGVGESLAVAGICFMLQGILANRQGESAETKIA